MWNRSNKISGGGRGKITISGGEKNNNRWITQFHSINREIKITKTLLLHVRIR